MKRVYDYHTGRMLNESETVSRSRQSVFTEKSNIQRNFGSGRNMSKLSEHADFYDSVIVNAKREIRTDVELESAIFSGKGTPVAIWEFKGNRCAEAIEKILDEKEIDYCSVNMRSLSGDVVKRINEIYDGETVLIIDEFTFGTPDDFAGLMDIVEMGRDIDVLKAIICIGIIDQKNNEKYADEIIDNFKNLLYSPDYSRLKSVEIAPDDEEEAYESVAEKFARYRKLYESESDEDDEKASADESDTDTEEGAEEKDKADEEPTKDDVSVDDSDTAEEETEDVPMTAIVLTVKKDDVSKCKEELVDAGIPEDAITEIEEDDEESENGKIKVDADYALELKDYLAGKGIDLEEKIGGEIIDDTVKDEEPGEDDGDSEESKDGEDEGELDFDKEFGDIFGDEE